MSYSQTISAKQAGQEHVLAVSRDFVSQPRLSEYIFLLLVVFVLWFFLKTIQKLGGSDNLGRSYDQKISDIDQF